jgi:hypothetical protein
MLREAGRVRDRQVMARQGGRAIARATIGCTMPDHSLCLRRTCSAQSRVGVDQIVDFPGSISRQISAHEDSEDTTLTLPARSTRSCTLGAESGRRAVPGSKFVSEAHLAFGPQMLHFGQHDREDASTAIDGLECEGHMVQVRRAVDQTLIFRCGDRTAPLPCRLQGKPLRFHARAVASVVRMVGAQEMVFEDHGVLAVPARFVEHGLSADEVWSMIANLVDLAETGEDAAMVLVLGREMKLHHIGHEVGVARLRLLVRAEVADLLDTQRGARRVPLFAPEDHKDQVGDLAPLVVVLIHEIAVHQTLTHLQLIFHKLYEGSLSLVLLLMPFPPLDITIEFTLAPLVLGRQTGVRGAKGCPQTLNLRQL